MRIKCIYSTWIEIPQEIRERNDYRNSDHNFSLEVGMDYTVYGMTVRDDSIWYYICDSTYSYYPVWKPSAFFEVIDSRLSRYWIYTYKKLINYISAQPIITFPEWANNHPDYYDKLTDGDRKEVEIFKAYKEIMDLEFKDPKISLNAQIGDDEWLMCPTCIDAWQETNVKDALVKCPMCKKAMNNPRFKKKIYD